MSAISTLYIVSIICIIFITLSAIRELRVILVHIHCPFTSSLPPSFDFQFFHFPPPTYYEIITCRQTVNTANSTQTTIPDEHYSALCVLFLSQVHRKVFDFSCWLTHQKVISDHVPSSGWKRSLLWLLSRKNCPCRINVHVVRVKFDIE